MPDGISVLHTLPSHLTAEDYLGNPRWIVAQLQLRGVPIRLHRKQRDQGQANKKQRQQCACIHICSPVSRVPADKNSALRNSSDFKSHLLPDNCSMRYGFCPILDSSENISSRLAQAVARERWITKSRGDVEIIVAETRRLEALGIVLGMLRLHEPKRGTTAMYETEADRQRPTGNANQRASHGLSKALAKECCKAANSLKSRVTKLGKN